MTEQQLKEDAKQKARSDMREAEPHNPYPVNSAQYWAYANEVNKAFNEEMESL